MKLERVLMNVVWIFIGSILIVLSIMGKVDSFYSGMGSALFIVGVIQLLRFYRLSKNELYRERLEIEANDERNHFLRNKAWAWSGYLFVFMATFTSVVLKMIGNNIASIVSAIAAIVMVLLYCVCYFVLKRKY